MAEELVCNHSFLASLSQSSKWICENVAVQACGPKQNFFNFFSMYYCDLEGNLPVLIFCTILIVIVIFKYTSITVEEYIAEGIQAISERLGLSESLAAITLLAFANGAGDVITALVASGTEGGVSYNIGSLYGAGLFVASAVVATCIIQSEKPMVFDKMIIYRDVGFYIIATLMCLFFAWYKFITWWSSLLLLGLYVAMVLVVIAHDAMAKEKVEQTPELMKELIELDQHDIKHNRSEDEESQIPEEGQKKALGGALAKLMLAIAQKREHDYKTKVTLTNGSFSEAITNFMAIQTYASHLKLKMNYLKDRRNTKKPEIPPTEALGKIIGLPYDLMLYLTSPAATKEHYSRQRCLIYPIPGMLFMAWVVLQEFSEQWLMVGGGLGLAVEVILYYSLPKEENKAPSWHIWLTVLAVVSGIAWTYVLIGMLIDLLNAFGIILNIDNTYLGLTILAIGNALPDALTTIALCKQGLGVMALSGGYAGQLFGLLVGFGISMLKLTLKEGPQHFDLFDMSKLNENFLDLLVLVAALVILVSTFVYGITNNFVMTKGFAKFLIVIYCLFIATATAVAFMKAMNHE
jgi:solute carrier family 24 (sodium/potassium/calcium exchanger), member 6